MAKEPPKPLVEVERAKQELRFNEAIKKCKTEKDFDAPLLEYVFGVFIAEAEALLDSGSELNWPVAKIRRRIEKALANVIDETFNSKHYNGQRLDSQFWKPGFLRTSTRAVRASDEWRLIQENLRRLAEWQAGNDIATTQAAQPQNLEEIKEACRQRRRRQIDAFIQAVLIEGRKIERKSIWTVAGYKDATEFERFQRCDKKLTKSGTRNLESVLSASPEEFLRRLDKKPIN